jgi:hypothetical protein
MLLPRQRWKLTKGANDEEHAMSEKDKQPFAMRNLTAPRCRYGS